MSTTGGGAGDLAIVPVPTICYPTTAQGWTLVSFSALNPVGAGPFGGIYPDATTFSWINLAASPGNPLHFAPAPGVYPNIPFGVPPGTLSALAGVSMDANEILVGPSFNILLITNVARITF